MKRCLNCKSLENDGTKACASCGMTDFEPDATLIVDERYDVVAKLGQGAMGIVYRAIDRGLRREVALKTIAPHHAVHRDVRERFQREAQCLASLRNDHVVQVYAFGQHGRGLFFAMEYIHGKPLDQIISEHNAHGVLVHPGRAATILRQSAAGLGAVHAKGLVHRDVKPANIVIEEDTGRPVLIDFGLARPTDPKGPKYTMRSGTPTYMAPEQAASAFVDASMLSARTDIYALGCIAFELFAGRPPFCADDLDDMLRKQALEEPPKLTSFRPEVELFEAVVERALAKNPAERFSHCGEFVEALDAAVSAWKPGARPPGSLQGVVPDLDDLRVLVVDDDDAFRRFALRAAEIALGGLRRELRTYEASNGAQALARFEVAQPRLVLLDFDMPGLDGIETLARMRAMPNGQDARIVVVTATQGNDVRWRFSSLGVRDFVSKPVDLGELADVMHDIAKRSGWVVPPRRPDTTIR